jgi:hypothetical protein
MSYFSPWSLRHLACSAAIELDNIRLERQQGKPVSLHQLADLLLAIPPHVSSVLDSCLNVSEVVFYYEVLKTLDATNEFRYQHIAALTAALHEWGQKLKVLANQTRYDAQSASFCLQVSRNALSQDLSEHAYFLVPA